ncbi:tyrosine-type recombinase/integrase [Cupriavidus sp. D39]|uniref:tyrosine-type recombinase/integrase n=1 Tax=Cupriavidus sp. D39 TaxID=2997877 RepID=UPI002271F476|nr:tyrosine-type recombinase/integrase [Cupriavidus sp. D39]MCY0856863.1 tyrosine-type recombinase/integrase [Cupriavidus sp. D39]
MKLYLRLNRHRLHPYFTQSLVQSFEHFYATNGDLSLSEVRKSHIRAHIARRIAMGLKTNSVRREIAHLAAATSAYLREKELDSPNPFHGVSIPNEGLDSTQRLPMPPDDIANLKASCYNEDDEIRWLLAMLIDTGARIAEIAGLALSDIVLNHRYPHIDIRAHGWRGLKSAASIRKLPLVGVALWAASRVVSEAKPGQTHAFPRYNKLPQTKRNGAASSMGAWMKQRDIHCQIHGLRHAFVDRLRRAGCPLDIRATLCGWSIRSIETRYGVGFGLAETSQWMAKIDDSTHLEAARVLPSAGFGRELCAYTCASRILAFITANGPATRQDMVQAGIMDKVDVRRGLEYARRYNAIERLDMSAFPRRKDTKYRMTGKIMPRSPTPKRTRRRLPPLKNSASLVRHLPPFVRLAPAQCFQSKAVEEDAPWRWLRNARSQSSARSAID